MKKDDFKMAIGAISYLVERLNETGNENDSIMAIEYEKLEKRMRSDFYKKYKS